MRKIEGATTFDAMQKTLHSLISYQTRPPWRLRFILDKTSSWGEKKLTICLSLAAKSQGKCLYAVSIFLSVFMAVKL